jgi:hydroxymethylpyrimidine kinase / phosphomethylpyrimidine kinase / thiamine-phosphate diphosphorylase
VRVSAPTIVWSIAGTDSGGGAGLTADQRAADAFNVHLCPVVAAVTAQNSRAVTHVEPLTPALIEAQLQALADDMPPAVVKTGLLGGVAQVRVVARWIDRLRARGPVALVVDPVLGASTGAAFADADTLAAYRDELVPRATVVTPNRREACALLGERAGMEEADPASLPALARRLRALGAGAVCITGGDGADVGGDVLDWVASAHAEGWLAAPRVATANHHGTGCTHASSIAAALGLGFVPADAVVLAKMATAHALRHGYAAGGGAGPVRPRAGFASAPGLLPRMTFGESPEFLPARAAAARPLGLYALVESADRVEQVLAAGVCTVQLRIKTPDAPDAAWHSALRREVLRSVQACRAAGAELFVNDHWTLARELGASGVHLGQEDLLALGDDGRRQLAASGLALGVSSHSLWELCRARGLAPRYIACGPVWPTLTKSMPWRPQGLHNLSWWRHMSGAPVVAIGGVLSPEQVRDAAACGVDGVCVVRALGEAPRKTVPPLLRAFAQGASSAASPAVPDWPKSVLSA